MVPISTWDEFLLTKPCAREKLVNRHKAEINHRIVLGTQPSLAPILIRFYLSLGMDYISEIISDWGEHAMNGFSLEGLGRFALGKMSLAEPVIQLGFFLRRQRN